MGLFLKNSKEEYHLRNYIFQWKERCQGLATKKEGVLLFFYFSRRNKGDSEYY